MFFKAAPKFAKNYCSGREQKVSMEQGTTRTLAFTYKNGEQLLKTKKHYKKACISSEYRVLL
jgi:hypothetical protein